MSDRTRITDLWDHLRLGELDVSRLSAEILMDCGVDASGLTSDDIVAMLHGYDSISWKDVAWAFNESLATYISSDLTEQEFGRAVIVACFLAEAIHRGHGDWQFSFDKMVKLICHNFDKGDVEFRMAYFRRVCSYLPVERGK